MKKYVNTAMITSGSADDFNKGLASTIEDFQNHGCEVEVQYTPRWFSHIEWSDCYVFEMVS